MKFINVNIDTWQLSGQLVMDKAHEVLAESERLQLPKTGLTLDFANVWAVDSAAVALLLSWVRRTRAENVSLRFSNVPANLISLIKLYGVEEIVGT